MKDPFSILSSPTPPTGDQVLSALRAGPSRQNKRKYFEKAKNRYAELIRLGLLKTGGRRPGKKGDPIIVRGKFISQVEGARRCKMHLTQYRRYIHGKTKMDMFVIKQLADGWECSMDEVYDILWKPLLRIKMEKEWRKSVILQK